MDNLQRLPLWLFEPYTPLLRNHYVHGCCLNDSNHVKIKISEYILQFFQVPHVQDASQGKEPCLGTNTIIIGSRGIYFIEFCVWFNHHRNSFAFSGFYRNYYRHCLNIGWYPMCSFRGSDQFSGLNLWSGSILYCNKYIYL